MNVRLEDIARELKLSIATVSRAMANDRRVKPETKKQVKAKAKQMGYRQNLIAKSLISGKTNVIGVIIPRYDEPFFIEVCRGIDQFARKNNYRILMSSSMNALKYEKENIQTFEKGTVDGVIISVTHETDSYNHIKELTSFNLPVVMFDNYHYCLKNTGHVRIDDEKAAFNAVDYLIRKGNHDIGFIGGTVKKTVFNHRYEGYVKAHNKSGVSYNTELTLSCNSIYQDYEYQEIYNFIENLSQLPDAFFCTTDNYAILLIKILKKFNIKVPDDVEVVGFGDLNYSKMLTPELSCVSQPSFKMGSKAAEMLISKINKGYYLPDRGHELVLSTRLIQRETTKQAYSKTSTKEQVS